MSVVKPLPLAIDRDSDLPIGVQLRDQLIWLIASRTLQPGDSLPSIRDLGARLGIHHHTVRAVYDGLREDGLVEIRRGLRATVRPFTALQLARPSAGRGITMLGVLIAGYDPFYLPFLRGVERVAADARALTIIAVSEDSPVKAALQIDKLVAAGVRGIIAASNGRAVEPRLARSAGSPALPIVYCDQPDQRVDSFVFDGRGAGRELADHLAVHHRRRIGLLAPSLEIPNVAELHQGLHAAVSHGTIDGVELVPADGFTIDDGERAAGKWLAARREMRDTNGWGLVAASDALALGALAAAAAAGVRIPDDVAVASYGQTDVAPFVRPALTAVRLPAEEMGKRAAEHLLRRLAGEHEMEPVVIRTTLEIRASCGRHSHGTGWS